MMEQRSILAAETIFEEMCVQTVLPHLGKDVNIRYTLEYSEQSGESRLILRWGGERFDPLTEGEELSVLIAKNSATEIDYTYTAEDEYPNRLSAKLR